MEFVSKKTLNENILGFLDVSLPSHSVFHFDRFVDFFEKIWRDLSGGPHSTEIFLFLEICHFSLNVTFIDLIRCWFGSEEFLCVLGGMVMVENESCW